MKLFCILLCIVFIFGIIAGCTGASASGTSTSGTSTVTSPSKGIDPILGSWINNTDLDPAKSLYVTFSQSGNIIGSFHNYKEDIGDWIKNQDGTYSIYLLANGKSTNYILIYDMNTDALYTQGDPEDILYRISATPTVTQTKPTVTRTKVIVTATPTEDKYQYCRDTYPGTSYNPSTNKCVYPTTVPTKTPTQAPIFTNPIIGTWKTTYHGINSEFTFLENNKGIKDGWKGGTWEKYDNTHYAFSFINSDTFSGASTPATIVFTYDSQLDKLSAGEGSIILVYNRS